MQEVALFELEELTLEQCRSHLNYKTLVKSCEMQEAALTHILTFKSVASCRIMLADEHI